jgi:hypothetical protein
MRESPRIRLTCLLSVARVLVLCGHILFVGAHQFVDCIGSPATIAKVTLSLSAAVLI